MAEPVEASSLYSGAPLFSFGYGVQFNVGDFLRPVYSEDFHEMSPLKSLDCIFQLFGEGPQFAVVDFDCVAVFSAVKNVIQCFESIYCQNLSAVDFLFRV